MLKKVKMNFKNDHRKNLKCENCEMEEDEYLFPQLMQVAKSVPRVHLLWKAEKNLFEIGKPIFEIRKQVLCKHLCKLVFTIKNNMFPKEVLV